MATMVKEKRREKKKPKVKTDSRSSLDREQPCLVEPAATSIVLEPNISSSKSEDQSQSPEKSLESNADTFELHTQTDSKEESKHILTVESLNTEPNAIEVNEGTVPKIDTRTNNGNSTKSQMKLDKKEIFNNETQVNTYQDLNTRLERISIPVLNQNVNLEDIQSRLENAEAYLKLDEEVRKQENEKEVRSETQDIVTDVTPSAPVFEEEDTSQYVQHPQHVIKEFHQPKVQSMSLEEAIKLYGGTEMERVKAWSEKEEAIVEAGPVSGPEHPLVDLLSTFRSSLIAIDRERLQLSKGYIDEEKYRKSLWRVETRWAEGSEECAHGSKVTACVKYEYAEFLKEKLPVAKLKLEGLLREVQDSYCHHQHTALLTHCQIEDLIAETIRSNKKEIREALALVLKALRMSDSAPLALAGALQRWAAALSAALLDARDTTHLLHLLHHLFR
ncbi:hypothetical protein O0L34_g16968 [Tuta absoluta]|nr:hypothetical protein O0L34_g16968 [Tuta absoluta]